MKPQISIEKSSLGSKVNSRYRGNAIGNAQNLFIRHILSKLGNESFSEYDWQQTKQHFENRCAYCDAEGNLVIDHAIPINRKKLGEHRIGNLIPCCRECNERKGDKDYIEYLDNNQIKIDRIQKYIDSRNYIPLGENKKVQKTLEIAYREIDSLASRYISIINELILDNSEVDLIISKDNICQQNEYYHNTQSPTSLSINQKFYSCVQKNLNSINFFVSKEKMQKLKTWERETNMLIAQKQINTGILWNSSKIKDNILKIIQKGIEEGRPSPYYGAIGGAYIYKFIPERRNFSFHAENTVYGQKIDLGTIELTENSAPCWKIEGEEYETLIKWEKNTEYKLGKTGTYIYQFGYTGLGETKKVLCVETNEKIDLTDYDNW